jgi:hypothetical protein
MSPLHPDDATGTERLAKAEAWNRIEVKDCPDLLQQGVYASTAFATRWARHCSAWDWIVTLAKQRWAAVAMPPAQCTSAGAIVALQLRARLLHTTTIWRLSTAARTRS